MPRNVRNFFVELQVDGRRSRVSTGPIRKDGGFQATIYIRDKGYVSKALSIEGFARGEKLTLLVQPAGDEEGSVRIERER